MGRDDWSDRQVVGVKAKRELHYGEPKNAEKANQEKVPVFLIISPLFKKVQMSMQDIMEKAGKKIICDGVELYRQAQNRLNTDLKGKVVGLVITDHAEDCYAATQSDFLMWKDTILKYQDNYIESWIDKISDELFPTTLTVITYFRRSKGKMSDEEIEKIEDEFDSLKEEHNINHKPCKTEDEVKKVVDTDLIGMALKQQQQKTKMQSFMRGRNQLLQKAKKLTADARKKR